MRVELLRDLRGRFGPARDQGERQTCLAFAASDIHAALRGPWSALSPEFIFYYAQRRAGRPFTAAAVLPATLKALKEDGQPVESDWPYLNSLPKDLDDYGPPAKVTLFRRNAEHRMQGLAEIATHLESGTPSLVCMSYSDAFLSPDAAGVVRAPASEQPDPFRRHAVVAVGHGRVDGRPALLVRNSWGVAWGLSGHAWLPEPYLAPRLVCVAFLTEE